MIKTTYTKEGSPFKYTSYLLESSTDNRQFLGQFDCQFPAMVFIETTNAQQRLEEHWPIGHPKDTGKAQEYIDSLLAVGYKATVETDDIERAVANREHALDNSE